MISGWKTITGSICTAIGGALWAGAEVAPNPDVGIWLKFFGTILVAFGGPLSVYGVAHKIEKKDPCK